MTQDDYDAQVRQIIAEQLGIGNLEVITRSSRIQEDLGADSLDIQELFIEFEDEFDLDISEEDSKKLRTFGQLVDYVDKRLFERDRYIA